MKIAEADVHVFAVWARIATAYVGPDAPRQVELHALAQGYELRCGSAGALRLEPTPGAERSAE